MAVMSTSVYSAALGMKTGVGYVVPFEQRPRGDAPVKVFYLLHGHSDDFTCWLYQSNAARYAADRGVLLVMPEVQRSWYANEPDGPAYYDYIARELPEITENLFGFTHSRAATFVAGLSMGGYGAMKIGMSNPGFYAGVGSFSGALDIASRRNDPGFCSLNTVFGSAKVPPEHDPMQLSDRFAALPVADRPKLYLSCGLSDFLYDDNQAFCRRLDQNGIRYTYEEWPGGHEWDFWDASFRRAMDVFGL